MFCLPLLVKITLPCYDMITLRKADLLWDDEAAEHIWQRHHLLVEDVIEAYYDPRAKIHKGKYNRQVVYGRTEAGQYLFIVVQPAGRFKARLITARPMTARDKQFYKR